MSHRRTHLWISLIVGVLVWGVYFAHVIQSLRRSDTGDLAIWFLGALALAVALEAGASGLITWLFRRRARALDDGPTLQAALRASHLTLMLLIAMVLTLAVLLALPALFGVDLISRSSDMPVIGANLLLAMVVSAELVRAAVTLALIPPR